MEKGSLILGMVAGFTLGAAAGILIAPARGAKTRKRLIHIAADYIQTLNEKFSAYTEELIHELKRAKSLAEKGKLGFEEAKRIMQ
jgi:gas vesicle protein